MPSFTSDDDLQSRLSARSATPTKCVVCLGAEDLRRLSAIEVGLKRDVAVKVLRPSLRRPRDAPAISPRGGGSRALRHPHIVRSTASVKTGTRVLRDAADRWSSLKQHLVCINGRLQSLMLDAWLL